MMPILTTEGRQEVEAILNTSLFFAKESGTVASPLTILENSIGVVLSNDLKHHRIMFNQSINHFYWSTISLSTVYPFMVSTLQYL